MTRQQTAAWSYDDEPPSGGDRATIAWLEWAIDTLGKLGCAPHPASRFPQSLEYIRRTNAEPELIADPEVRSQLAEIQRAAWELLLIVIATVQVDRATSPFTRAKLLEMFGGGLAADDSHGRNIQYELYVPALFVIGDFAVRRGDPDAQLLVYNEWLGIEAKRIGSSNPNTLRRTLSRAATQVTGSSTSTIIEVVRSRGFLAVNLDGFFESVDADQDQEQLIKEFERQLAILDREARVLQKKTGIVGLLATGHIGRWRHILEPDRWRIDTIYPFRWLGLHGQDPTDVVLTKGVMPQMDRLQRNVLALRTKVPKKFSRPIPPAA